MDIRKVVFNNRSYTPIPLIIAVLLLANPNWVSFIIGIAIAIGGEILRIWAVAHAGSSTRTTSGAGGEELIMSGPFAYMRNPLYTGNFLMTIGLCVAAWPWMPWMGLIVIVLFVAQYSLIISLEESYLQERFPRLYQGYREKVPRIVPRLTSFDSGQKRIPSYKEAFRSERSTLASFVAVSILILIRWQVWGL